MAATAPASRHSRAADVVEEHMVTPGRTVSQVVGAAEVDVYSFQRQAKHRHVIGNKMFNAV